MFASTNVQATTLSNSSNNKIISSSRGDSQILRRGSRGGLVEFLQRILLINGFYPGKNSSNDAEVCDSIFGPETEAAVKRLQRKHHITIDGIVGPETWGVIDRYYPQP